METALPYLHDDAGELPVAEHPRTSSARRLVLRDGTFQLDNGYCRDTIRSRTSTGAAPAKTANCKPNEVDVPNVVGDDATRRASAGSRRSR